LVQANRIILVKDLFFLAFLYLSFHVLLIKFNFIKKMKLIKKDDWLAILEKMCVLRSDLLEHQTCCDLKDLSCVFEDRQDEKFIMF
jgi:hypothetical protein